MIHHNKKLVVGNWKCHKSLSEGKEWFDRFAAGYRPSDELVVVVAPTFLCLEGIAAHLKNLNLENVYLAAQDISPFPRGGYTGAIAADMVRAFADFVIVGHSDRRRYFHETSQDVTNKVSEAVDAGLQPIVCVDQPYAMSQLTALKDIDSENIIIGYTPVDALSFRIPESTEKVIESVIEIRNMYPNRSVIYGGSLTRENVGSYLELQELSGVFVGAASLDADSFLEICGACS